MQREETVLYRWFDRVWNRGDESAIDAMFAADGVAHGLDDAEPVRGPAGFRPFFRAMRGAFPDVRITVHDVLVDGDREAARCTVRGTHRGDQLGIPATGRSVSFDGIALVRTCDGQIVEAWNGFDFLSLYRQLGRAVG